MLHPHTKRCDWQASKPAPARFIQMLSRSNEIEHNGEKICTVLIMLRRCNKSRVCCGLVYVSIPINKVEQGLDGRQSWYTIFIVNVFTWSIQFSNAKRRETRSNIIKAFSTSLVKHAGRRDLIIYCTWNGNARTIVHPCAIFPIGRRTWEYILLILAPTITR